MITTLAEVVLEALHALVFILGGALTGLAVLAVPAMAMTPTLPQDSTTQHIAKTIQNSDKEAENPNGVLS